MIFLQAKLFLFFMGVATGAILFQSMRSIVLFFLFSMLFLQLRLSLLHIGSARFVNFCGRWNLAKFRYVSFTQHMSISCDAQIFLLPMLYLRFLFYSRGCHVFRSRFFASPWGANSHCMLSAGLLFSFSYPLASFHFL